MSIFIANGRRRNGRENIVCSYCSDEILQGGGGGDGGR